MISFFASFIFSIMSIVSVWVWIISYASPNTSSSASEPLEKGCLYKNTWISAVASKTDYAMKDKIQLGATYITRNPDKSVYASLPFCSISLYKKILLLKILSSNFKIYYKDIDYIKNNTSFKYYSYDSTLMTPFYIPNAIRIKHHNPKVPKHIYIQSLNINKVFQSMKSVSKENNLKIKFIG